jgi:hypothetical protein
MKQKFIVVQLLFTVMILTNFSCTKGSSSSSPTVIGSWRVDSLTNLTGGDTKTALMDTPYSAGYKTLHIVIAFKDDSTASATNYSHEIAGVFSVASSSKIHFVLKEMPDKLLLPPSDFQPLFIKSMNDASSYKIDGDGSLGTKLSIFYASEQSVIHLSKL